MAEPNPSHTTTVVETRRSSGAGVIIAIAVLLAVIAGVFFVSQLTGSETAKNNAITNAADSVSNAADKAGDAAEGATK